MVLREANPAFQCVTRGLSCCYWGGGVEPCAAGVESGLHSFEDLSSSHYLPLYLDIVLGSFKVREVH